MTTSRTTMLLAIAMMMMTDLGLKDPVILTGADGSELVLD